MELHVLVGRAVGPDEVGVEVVVVAGLGHLLGDRRPAVAHPTFEHEDLEARLREIARRRQPVVAAADDDPVELPLVHVIGSFRMTRRG